MSAGSGVVVRTLARSGWPGSASPTDPAVGVGDDSLDPPAVPAGEGVLAGVGLPAGVGDAACVGRSVGVDVGDGDDGASTSRKVTASKYTVAGAAEAGRSIKRTLADRAPVGAWTGPVVSGRNRGSSESSISVESTVVSAEPLPSALLYQERRRNTAAAVGSDFNVIADRL